jgi:GT2 family glycosyltransferase
MPLPHSSNGPNYNPKVSVVIPTNNTGTLIGSQLKALAGQQMSIEFEVLVVDYRSTDETVSVAREWADRFRSLKIIDAPELRGAAYARNVGARAARSDNLLFCDADDEVAPGWVKAMADALDAAELVGGAIEVEQLNFPDVFKEWYNHQGLLTALGFMPFANGCNLGVRRRVLEQVGGFDETFLQAEDVDFSWRVQLAGYHLMFVPDSIVHYRLRQGVRAIAKQHFHWGRSNVKLYAKFRDRGIPGQRIHQELRQYREFVLRSPYLLWTARSEWIRQASFIAGHLVGEAKYRMLAPLDV